LYFFAIKACRDTGCGTVVGVGAAVEGGGDTGGVDGERLPDCVGAMDGVGATDGGAGVVEFALGVDAGGAASSVVQATTAVITNATTPAHAIRRSMSSSLPPGRPQPVESSHNDRATGADFVNAEDPPAARTSDRCSQPLSAGEHPVVRDGLRGMFAAGPIRNRPDRSPSRRPDSPSRRPDSPTGRPDSPTGWSDRQPAGSWRFMTLCRRTGGIQSEGATDCRITGAYRELFALFWSA
jgi:hypothetical protein